MKIFTKASLTTLPKAVLLDLDDTLYSYEDAHTTALRSVKEKIRGSLSISFDDFDSAYLQSRGDVKRRLAGTAAAHSRILYFQRMLELFGLKSQPLLALDLEQTYWRSFLDGSTVFDGVVEFLDQLRLLGIPTAIVTDQTAQIQLRKLVFFGLDKLIDFVVTSEEAGADKPGAALFQIALEKLEVRDGPVWMVGDSAERDLRGSRVAIGAVTIQKLHKGGRFGTRHEGLDASIREFTELNRFLTKLSYRTARP